MTSAITLDDIREAAARKYAATPVDLGEKTVELKNPLRLSKDARDKLSELKAEDFEDTIDYFEAAFALASSEADAKAIREVYGEDDLTLYAVLFEMYSKGTEVGEASPSQD